MAERGRKRSVRTRGGRQIRYAVVGLGHIAQAAVLPAFAHAHNCRLSALVSSDRKKLDKLCRQYDVRGYSYDQFEECLGTGEVDAVYVTLPNNLHREYTVRAANAGVHTICEKPMAMTESECAQMIRAAEGAKIKLMIAYRLHFERANLEAVEIARSGRIGDPRFFDSVFSQQVRSGNIRTRDESGGGTLLDMGIYCINAARYLFRAEPVEVMAFTSSRDERRFGEVEEMTGALLRFPEGRLATFVVSFGAADTDSFRIVGTKGDLRVEPAYEYVGTLKHHLTVDGRTREREFEARDQFAAQLVYFSNCILHNRPPEPSGLEGLIDVRIIEALYQSAQTGHAIELEPVTRKRRLTRSQSIRKPPVQRQPELVGVVPPGR